MRRLVFSEHFRPVNKLDHLPLYAQIISQIERAIRRGTVTPGDCLPSETELCEGFRVSKKTLRKATDELSVAGTLRRSHGVGTFIGSKARFDSIGGIHSIHAELAAANRLPSTEVLKLERVIADQDLSLRHGYDVGTALFDMRRLRYANGEPVVILENYLPCTAAPLTVARLTDKSLDQVLRGVNYRPRFVRQELAATTATPAQAELLRIDAGTPVITERMSAFGADDELMNVSINFYHPEHYKFQTTLETLPDEEVLGLH